MPIPPPLVYADRLFLSEQKKILSSSWKAEAGMLFFSHVSTSTITQQFLNSSWPRRSCNRSNLLSSAPTFDRKREGIDGLRTPAFILAISPALFPRFCLLARHFLLPLYPCDLYFHALEIQIVVLSSRSFPSSDFKGVSESEALDFDAKSLVLHYLRFSLSAKEAAALTHAAIL